MSILSFTVIALWLVVVAMAVMMWVMLRQIGVLYERVAPVGALMDQAGPQVGEASPVFPLQSLTGGNVRVGASGTKAMLVFFLSPTCPVCKQLLPALAGIQSAEKEWLDVVLASDGNQDKHLEFITRQKLSNFPYVLSTDLGMAYRVQRLPFAVLVDQSGTVKAKGLINNREQLDSLFNALDAGVASFQQMKSIREAG
ncbi:MAG: methylamine dehydrogenase accessory protein MauD [Alphaproteobacteria bacterium]|nr:methylamine dehydrogenase accessory protein MauD [Alphaproteobacteria bacterium]